MCRKTECKVIGLTLACIFASCIQMPTASAQVLSAEAATGPHRTSGSKFTFKTIPDPPSATRTTLMGVNVEDQIVGTYYDANGSHGFLYDSDKGTLTLIGPSPDLFGVAVALNDRGQILGWDYPPGFDPEPRFFLYTAGTYSTIAPFFRARAYTPSGINNSAQVVGTFKELDSGLWEGFMGPFSDFGLFKYPDAYGTQAMAINDEGQIVGWTQYQDTSPVHPFLYSNGNFTILDDALASPSRFYFPYGINDAGEVVGTYRDLTNETIHGFVYRLPAIPRKHDDRSASDSEQEMEHMEGRGVFFTVDHPLGPGRTSVNGINNRGQLIGSYTSATGESHNFLATPVEEREER